ncbi:GntR family transcriptional regulator [Paeniglutamicibacter kerguelensis]|uniref:GntR family transcriptional regulator n=1 Tax=Paeniglutamicibacter kerguelensis TaxID=254788 RepID=A0ABS4XED1_9MICC|nr:GntR family transcriptional regulator [Paeniglutamicibacter kerguelensis]
MKPYAPQPPVLGAIDEDSSLGKYRQIREILRTHAKTVCEPGFKLPPERELAASLGVARKTLRQAIDSLVEDQVLKRVVGVGTFVAHPKVDLQVRLNSYSEEMIRRGMVPDAHVLRFDEVPASGSLSRHMQIDEGAPVIRFRRLLLADGKPMSLDENFMPSDLVPGFLNDPPPISLYQSLHERYGLVLEWGEDQIESTAATAANAGLLQVEVGFPLLKITRYAFVGDGLVDYSVSLYRSDRYKLFVPLQRQGSRTPRYTTL